MDTDKLGRIGLFQGLTEDDLATLARVVTARRAARGERLFDEGQRAEVFYCIVSGSVRVFKATPEGKEHTVHQLGPGETFAEVVAFAGAGYPAHAEALADTELLAVPRAGLRGLIADNPDLAMNMMALMSRRMMGLLHKVEQLSLREVPARLATHLLLLSEQTEGQPTGQGGEAEAVTLDMPKGRLASYLGATPETLSRSLARLAEAGLIEAEGGRVRILDRQALSAVAQGEGF